MFTLNLLSSSSFFLFCLPFILFSVSLFLYPINVLTTNFFVATHMTLGKGLGEIKKLCQEKKYQLIRFFKLHRFKKVAKISSSMKKWWLEIHQKYLDLNLKNLIWKKCRYFLKGARRLVLYKPLSLDTRFCIRIRLDWEEERSLKLNLNPGPWSLSLSKNVFFQILRSFIQLMHILEFSIKIKKFYYKIDWYRFTYEGVYFGWGGESSLFNYSPCSCSPCSTIFYVQVHPVQPYYMFRFTLCNHTLCSG